MNIMKLFSFLLAVFLLVIVGISTSAPAFAKGKGTILAVLERTDGSQALVAVIRVADKSGACTINTEALLNDKKNKLVVFAPSNRAFDIFLKLPEGGFDGMSIDVIVLALPGILNGLVLTDADLCDVLLKHISEHKKPKKKAIARKLLEEGDITVVDGSKFPIAVGEVGPSINYEASITERDVFTVNGIIHYINNVIVDAEEPDPDLNVICDQEKCLTDPVQRTQCENFLALCLASINSQRQCVAGGLLICNEPNFNP